MSTTTEESTTVDVDTHRAPKCEAWSGQCPNVAVWRMRAYHVDDTPCATMLACQECREENTLAEARMVRPACRVHVLDIDVARTVWTAL